MKQFFNRAVTRLLVASLTVTSLLAPAQLTLAATTGTADGQFSTPWRDIQATETATVSVPADNWQLVGSMASTGSTGDDLAMLSGERWIVANQQSAGALGLSSSQVSSLLERFPSNGTLVVARFQPDAAQLRISALKVIKKPEGTTEVYVSDFTPHHGEYFKAARLFLTPSERADVYRVGYNPFQSFRGANTDPTFYNVSSGAAQVAMGWALAYHRGIFGLFIESTTRLEQAQTKSGGLLKKKITTTTRGYAKPKFYIAVPLEMSTARNTITPANFGVICATGASSCDHQDHVAMSGIALEQYTGGNMPEIEEQVYLDVETKSSWTGLFFALVTALVTWGIGGMITGQFGWAASGSAATGATSATGLTASTVGMGAGQIGLYAGIGYAGVNSLVNGGPLTSAQGNWLGDMGWNPSNISNGVVSPQTCNGERHCTNLSNNTLAHQITPPSLSDNNLQGTRRLVSGDCGTGSTVASCTSAGQNPGFMPRPDSYVESNGVRLMKDRVEACQNQGLAGSALRRCIAAPEPRQ